MTLENKIGQERPSLQQWIPVWGLYQVYKDGMNGEPTIIDDEGSWKYHLSAVYHAASLVGSIVGLGYYLADKF